MLFLLPFAMLAIAKGAEISPRAGTVIAGGAAGREPDRHRKLLSGARFIEHRLPRSMDRIARDIAAKSSPADTIVLVDGPNLSGVVLEYYLPGFRHAADLHGRRRAGGAAETGNPSIRHVWFLRNPRDVRRAVLERLEADLRQSVGRVNGE
jgi:hypothetical protein